MSMTSSPSGDGPVTETAALPRWVSVLFVILFALVIFLLVTYFMQRQALSQAQQDGQRKTVAMATELDKTNARIADLKGQLEVTSQKLGLTQDELARARGLAQTVRQEQQSSDASLRQQMGAFQTDTNTKFGQVQTQINGAQSDITATKADLETTKGKLQSTIGDLGIQSGLIAKNHDEVEELKRLNDRDIFEFSLSTKTKSPQHVGPIQVQLRKADPKHNTYTMNVIVDDKSLQKKDRTIDEPVQFYTRGARAPFEIVVFDLTKNEAKGYLSAPKTATEPPPAPAATATPPGN